MNYCAVLRLTLHGRFKERNPLKIPLVENLSAML